MEIADEIKKNEKIVAKQKSKFPSLTLTAQETHSLYYLRRKRIIYKEEKNDEQIYFIFYLLFIFNLHIELLGAE